MNTMEIIKLNNRSFYEAMNIKDNYPDFFKGCKTVRHIIERKDIPDEAYCWATFVSNKWKESIESYKKARLLISKKWLKKEVDLDEYEKHDDLPPLIEIDDNDILEINGERLEIEIRGKRTYDNIYFSVKDVSECFESKNLKYAVLKNTGGYVLDQHYKLFTDDNNKTQVYFTYFGFCYFLYVSRKGNNLFYEFQQRATKTLFTHQLGTQKQKMKLVSKMGINVENLKEFFNLTDSKFPCIYFLVLGTVESRRADMEISTDYDDDMYVCKYGFTNDLNRRLREHTKNFGNLHLKYHCWIDPSFLPKAESDVREILSDYHFEFENNKELVILSEKKLARLTKKIFDMADSSYSGKLNIIKSEYDKKINDYENEIKLLKMQLQSKDKELKYCKELAEKDRLIRELEKKKK